MDAIFFFFSCSLFDQQVSSFSKILPECVGKKININIVLLPIIISDVNCIFVTADDHKEDNVQRTGLFCKQNQ